MNLERLRCNLDDVRRRIGAACARAGRDPAGVSLVVVTKSAPGELIPRLAELGVTDVGENRPLEGLRRLGALAGFRRHMIGHVQTNKLNKMLRWADVLHSVDRAALLGELARAPLARAQRKLPVFVQVNVSGEATKGGFRPEETADAVAEARRSMEVLGLMTMAPEGGATGASAPGARDARTCFRRLRDLGVRCGVPGLSMGMSQDFEAAVEEGATVVRIGSAIFEGVWV